MNLRQIETFAAVMRCGTASRAAEVLGVTQPAVSRSIGEFERSVGFPLFARIRNRLVATPEARMLYEEVKAAFHGIDAIRAVAARIRDHGSGEIRIASLFAASHSVIPKAVAIFRRKHPQARITLLVLPSRDVRDLIASGQFDVGLAADMIDTTGIVHENFMARDALCALPIGHELSSRKIIVPMDLHDVPFVAYLPEDRFRQRVDGVLAAAGAIPKIVVETAFAPTALALVAAGVGVTLASPHAIGGFDRSKIVVKQFKPGVDVRVLLLLPSDRPKSQLVRDFVDALMAAR
ncbi:LysR substrate-binding domain-containing protein [Bradyrhizobium sp. LMTR 3]|uniref:LysR substrate-binding domain-containing protein n=1 Tax=Bradyrhizobium sp. LMTR 3 TaxID=189873 RepID=UPI000810D205|nr:LysR substrate-binding domain-containing protein [Bradyrhizobium sp. LMTR 3]OCK59045.1 LysR family transcriptional regulator [Bradyrhizobium sp. LMTR 3]